MFDLNPLFAASRTWQRASMVYGQMLFSATMVIQHRMTQMALGTMKPQEAARMVFEKPAAFAKAFEMAARTQAANKGAAAVSLAAIKPIGARTRANAARLGKTRRR
jgi:hypothetical protein